MHAQEIMTTELVTVAPSTPVTAIVELLVAHRIGAVPVVAGGRLVGIVSASDLIHRAEAGTEAPRSWWRELVRSAADQITIYRKCHGRDAQAVMTHPVATVAPTTPIAAVAELLDREGYHRVPVVDGDRLVGIVSRSDLMRPLLQLQCDAADERGDRDVQDAVEREIRNVRMWTSKPLHVLVRDGRVALYGAVDDAEESEVLELAARVAAGARPVDNNLVSVGRVLHAGF